MKNRLFKAMLIAVLTFSLAGCTFIIQKGRRSDVEKIEELSTQLDDLTQAKRLLEDRLQQEIQDRQVKLQMMEKGLVITVVGDLLFDSGKAKIKQEGYPVLDKVARVLKENMADFNVGIEGYTDNQPIKHSKWKSNWELSSARALSVLHYLAKEQDISGERLSAVGFGEYHPVANNATGEGRHLNRRVEIVIQPRVTKVKEKKAAMSEPIVSEPQENLK
jgi:chemotaxis protein MotB